jgi:hypothetical protein
MMESMNGFMNVRTVLGVIVGLFIYSIFVAAYPATASLVSTRSIVDSDQDGIPDSKDLCPYVFKNTNISDSDNDGIGDECDTVINVPPVDLSKSTDTDTDGLNDNLDNCPEVANPDQKDTDADGIGDVCDSIVNPPPIALPKTILPETEVGIEEDNQQVQEIEEGQGSTTEDETTEEGLEDGDGNGDGNSLQDSNEYTADDNAAIVD